MNFSRVDENAAMPNILQERQADYGKAERDLLLDALRRTHKERFLFATRLYKIQQLFKRAVITHHP